MIKTLLFDLDDTLLGNSMETFLPPYFGKLARQYPELEAGQVAKATQQAAALAQANQDPTITLDRVFADSFTPTLGRPESEWRERYATFYADGFNALQSYTEHRPEAREVLEFALAAGYRVVIATNALFPRAAVEARLRWAGIADLALARVTVLEDWHFAKPNPAYFAEILADLGLRPQDVLMIGNDPVEDVSAASKLGIPCWWVTDDALTPDPAGSILVGRGPLRAFATWARDCLPTHHAAPGPANALPDLLSGSLARLWAELVRLREADDAWTRTLAAGAWSANEVALHLRDVEAEVNGPRIDAVLTQENPFIAGVDTDQWATQRSYNSTDGRSALDVFAQTRRAVIARLRGLAPDAYQRTARHALLGRTTLSELLQVILDHDQVHLRQLRALAG